jgi:60 kDa SS-A/Ro ribonucleoprotein
MDAPLAHRSEMVRMDAACGIAVLLREVCEAVEVYSFSDTLVLVPPRRGFALRDAIVASHMAGRSSGTP